ncbi:hypothetical protein Tco_0909696 [Tanacetum coccineum]|uniref:Uncharacterized protein n=1 Tax=Tanacetum coccineum TaxID=301880 RepID=A0ABQ5CQQ4_9ASTR
MSSLALDTNSSQPPASTLVDVGMHKEDQQVAGGPTSLGVSSEEGAHPQLSRRDTLVDSIAEVDPGKYALNDSIPQQQVWMKEPKTIHLITSLQIEEASLGGDEFTSSDKISKKINLEDLSKLVQNVKVDFMDLDSLKDDPIIMVDESKEYEEDKDEEVYATLNVETEDTSTPKPPSHSSIPTKLKDLSSKFNDLTEEIKGLKKHVHKLEIELPGDLKEIPKQLKYFTTTMSNLTTQVAKLKTLDALPCLLDKVTKALNQFAQAIASVSKKTEDASVPSANQASTQPAEGEKNTNQATISQLFQRKAAKDANLNKHQSIPTPQIITTTTLTTSLQSYFISSPPKSFSQTEGEHIKKYKGKKAMSSKDVEEESSDSEYDDTINLTGSKVESSKMKKLNKFNFVTEDGDHVH